MRKRISACLAALAMLFVGSARASDAVDPNIQLLPGWQGSENAPETVTQVSYSSLAEASLAEAEGCGSCGGGSSCGGSCDMGGSCGGGCCDCCPCGTLNFRGELLVVQPFASNRGGVGRFGLDFSPRFTLGYTLDSGLGIRGRYWFFDHSAPNAAGLQRLEAHTFDLEVTQTFDVGNFQGLGFLGARRVYFKNGNPAAVAFQPGFVEDEFTGYGITGGLELVRPLTEKLSLYGTGRASIVMGQQEFAVNGALAGTFSRATRSIYELGGGGQWQTELDNGVVVTARGGVEFQSWEEFDQVSPGHGGDIGFFGFVSSLQFTY